VTLAMVGTGVVVIVANAAKGQAPKPRAVLGLGAVYMALAALGDFAPQLAGPFAALVFTGTLLTEGAPALDALAGALQGTGQLGLPDAGKGSGAAAGQAGGAGGSHAVPAGTQTGRDLLANPRAENAVQWALKMRGVPYVWAGESPQGFDCSGLMQWSYAHAGVSIPRTAAAQQTQGSPVDAADLLPGDLVFQGNPAHHVVMAIGGGQCVSAPHTGARVRTEGVAYYLQTDPGGARRILPAQTPSQVHQTRRAA
jgi:cell wall-associated NlpC family hydrolase